MLNRLQNLNFLGSNKKIKIIAVLILAVLLGAIAPYLVTWIISISCIAVMLLSLNAAKSDASSYDTMGAISFVIATTGIAVCVVLGSIIKYGIGMASML